MKTVYMSFSTDVIHGGHIRIIQQAATLGRLTVGVLTDRVVASYRRFPILSTAERMEILRSISGIAEVVEQDTLSYKTNLQRLQPDYLVHGDDWRVGFQASIREEAIQTLAQWGGELKEFPYSNSEAFLNLENYARAQLSIPDIRRGRLRKLLGIKPLLTALEAHNGLTGLLVEETKIIQNGEVNQFDAIWISSLCDSTAKGKPDIELVDMTSRIRTIDDVMEVTTKPIIFDGDTGGQIEHVSYLVRTLERLGVSAIILEDKVGPKKNSLFGTDVEQEQDSLPHFCEKIHTCKNAMKTRDMMIIARIESFNLDKSQEDALERAFAYVQAGADGIMIHSRRKDPDEIFTFCEVFRAKDSGTPLVLVPTTFHSITEEEFKNRGVNIIIYANHLIRSAFPAMKKAAETILTNHRAQEADALCMPIKEILTLIPED